MNRFSLRLSTWNLCLGFVVSTIGCQGEVPKSTILTPPSAPPVVATQPATPPVSTPEAASTDLPFALEQDFALVTREQFEAFGSEPDTWKVTSDGLLCTGKPRGYLYSQQSYKNFTLKLDYRFPRPANLKDDAKFKGNTGFLVYITGEQKLWPICIEVQGKFVQMAAIKENGGAAAVITKDDESARQQARKPVGEWNELEIVSKSGTLQVSLNGTPISSSEAGELQEGFIGIQSEDHPFEVRRMRIRVEE